MQVDEILLGLYKRKQVEVVIKFPINFQEILTVVFFLNLKMIQLDRFPRDSLNPAAHLRCHF